MANRPGYGGYRRSLELEKKAPTPEPPPPPTDPPKTNGHIPKPAEPPKPAPRRIPSMTEVPTNHNGTSTATTTNHKKTPSNASLDAASSSGDDVQVLPKPITNEEFQAMIPAHFLKHPKQNNINNNNNNNNSCSDNNEGSEGKRHANDSNVASAVTVTIKKPDPIELPPAPTGPGRVTETITKSTFTETVVTRITDNQLLVPVIVEDVTLSKAHGSLGFSIIGGTDHSSIPFGVKEPGIFISHMVPGGTAASCGKLRVGDRILKVNGTDVTSATHQEAVMELLRPCEKITLTVRHDPLPDGYQELVIEKSASEKLGMHIKGGLQGQRGNPLDKSDEGVFISKINSAGAARRDGRLRTGMRLLEVNGKSLLGATHQEAVNALRSCGDVIHLVVCRGYERAEVDKAIAEGRLTRAGSVSSRSHSVSSLDVPDEDVQQEQNMKSELVQFEKEEAERRLKLPDYSDEELHLVEAKPTTPADKVLDVVRAVETLAHSPTENSVPPKSPGGPNSELKTTTIVMSKHTLAPQVTETKSSTLPKATKPPPFQTSTMRSTPIHSAPTPPSSPVIDQPERSSIEDLVIPPPTGYEEKPPELPKTPIPSLDVVKNSLESKSLETLLLNDVILKPIPSPRPVSLVLNHQKHVQFSSPFSEERKLLGKPPQSPKSATAKSSVSDRKKFFETAMEESQKPAKPEKVFSYLSSDELEKLKAEEEKKIANLSAAEVNMFQPTDDHSDTESFDSQNTGSFSHQSIGVVRTAKAERRLKDKLREEGLLTDEDDLQISSLSPAQERALRAEKRAAWRAARLKSLEQDAMQAQMVIKSMTDMVGASGDMALKHQEIPKEEVETLQEKIISLELTKPEDDIPDSPINGEHIPKEFEELSSEPPTPTTGDEKTFDEDSISGTNKRRRRKRSKKGKH